MLFKMVPKHHVLWHVAKDVATTRVNPKTFQCFHEEGFLGCLKRIAIRCHGVSVATRALECYRVALAGFLHEYGG